MCVHTLFWVPQTVHIIATLTHCIQWKSQKVHVFSGKNVQLWTHIFKLLFGFTIKLEILKVILFGGLVVDQVQPIYHPTIFLPFSSFLFVYSVDQSIVCFSLILYRVINLFLLHVPLVLLHIFLLLSYLSFTDHGMYVTLQYIFEYLLFNLYPLWRQ
jgi:hypothetical protein